MCGARSEVSIHPGWDGARAYTHLKGLNLEAMAEEARPAQEVEHVRHEERVEDWLWQLDVTKVTRALEVVESASRAAAREDQRQVS